MTILEQTYTEAMHDWQQLMETRMRAEDGWLTVVGLEWLNDGDNTIGSAPDSDVVLPEGHAPEHLGVIHFVNKQATLELTNDEPVKVDGVVVKSALLRDDSGGEAPSRVDVRTVTFFVIKRGDKYGIRIRDTASEARQNFTGRAWFPVNEDYRVTGRFIPHESKRTMDIEDVIGLTTAMANPGAVDFELHGQTLRLEALDSGEEIWFVFRDATSGKSTYGASRFLKAKVAADNSVVIDFNQAYHPPCYFTHYATCPLPPRENILNVAIEAGEKLPE